MRRIVRLGRIDAKLSAVSRKGSSWTAAQIQGSRNYQEDSFDVLEGGSVELADSATRVLILADGMGGHAGGDTASGIVVRSIMSTYGETGGPVTDRLRDCLDAANDAVADEVDGNPQLSGMGTTLVVAVATGGELEWISVGDSPLWLYRNGHLRRLNADHSMGPVLVHLVQAGEISAEEAATDKRRNALRSAVCGDELALIDVSSQPLALQSGDLIVLASDGIDTLTADELAEPLAEAPAKGLDALVTEILERVQQAKKPNQDNMTLMLCAPLGLVTDSTRADDRTLAAPSPRRRTPAQRRALRLWLAAGAVGLIAAIVALIVGR